MVSGESDGGTDILYREFQFIDDGREGFVQVPSTILWDGFKPVQRRVYLACLTWADFQTGWGKAGLRTLAWRCGRAPSPVARALRRLRAVNVGGTERRVLEGKGRRWQIYVRQKGHVYGRLPNHVLETFGFRFYRFDPPPTAAEGTNDRSRGHTAPQPRALFPQPRAQTTAAEGTHT